MIAFTVLVWLVTLAKVPAAWRNRAAPLTRSYWLALASLTVAMTLDQPRVYVAVGRWLHLANIAFLFDYGGGVVAALCGQAFLWYAQGSPDAALRVRRRTRFVLAVLAVLAVTYVTGLSQLPNSHDTAHDPARTWGQLVMRLTLAVWAAYALGDVAVLSFRFARRAAARPLRVGLLSVTVGAVLAMTRFVVEYGGYALWSWRHTSQSASELDLIRALNVGALVGFALMAGGFGLPALARTLGTAGLWLVDLDRYRRLSPLWREVAPSVPTLGGPLGLRGRLYRRLIEIQDGYLTLEPYRDPGREEQWRSEAARRGLDGRAAEAFVDAHSLRDAALTYRTGDRTDRASPRRTTTERAATEDVRYLLQVAAHLPTALERRGGASPVPRGSGYVR